MTAEVADAAGKSEGLVADWRALLVLAAPMLVASSADLLLNVVDTVLAGRLDNVGFAAVAVGAAIHSVASQVAAAALIGYQIVAQRRLGAGGPDALRGAFHATMPAVLLIGALVTLIGWTLAPFLTNWVASDGPVGEEAATYLRLRLLGLMPWALLLFYRYTFDADKQTGVGARVAVVMNLANAGLSYALMFGAGPIPALGAAGAGAGSAAADLVGLALVIAYARKSQLFLALGRRWRPSGSASELRVIGRLSGPEVVSSALDYGGGLVFFALIGALGTTALAAGRLTYTVMLVMFVSFFTLGVAGQILAGRAIGAQLGPRPVQIFRRTLYLSVILGLSTAAVVALGSPAITEALTTQPETQIIAQPAVVLMAAAAPFIAATTASVGMLRAMGRTKWVMVTNLTAVWVVQVPVAAFAVYATSLGLAGAFAGLFTYFVVRAIWSFLLTKSWRMEAADATASTP